MADISAELCPGREGTAAAHCWHVVWRPSFHQAKQYDGGNQKCCWCGAERPLTIGYQAPIAHGKHKPHEPFYPPSAF